MYLAVGAGLVVIGVAIVALTTRTGGSGSASSGLPNTPDYHSLVVDGTKPNRVLLGTHAGLYSSGDGGRHWRFFKLANRDAMNLARGSSGTTIWMAGHDVLARSDDGGETWQELRPPSLPGLDVHGFAVDPRARGTVYAAIAGQGLYRSTDGGSTFEVVSRSVGGGVMALAVTSSGDLLAGDMQRGLLRSSDGGKTWQTALKAQLAGLAVNPRKPRLILAAGPGVLRSANGGRTWKRVLEVPAGAGPIAWSPSDPARAYVVGFDRTLSRSNDGGATWYPAP